MPSPSSARLTLLALAVLNGAIEQAKKGRVAATPGLRLALGYLYSSERVRAEQYGRAQCEMFWKWAVTVSAPTTMHGGSFGGARKVHLDETFARLVRATGFADTPDLAEQLTELLHGEASE